MQDTPPADRPKVLTEVLRQMNRVVELSQGRLQLVHREILENEAGLTRSRRAQTPDRDPNYYPPDPAFD